MNGQPKRTFSLKQLFVALSVASIPIALSTTYWKNVTDTTDDLPVALADSGLTNQALFLAFLLVSFLIVAGIGYFLISSRRFATLAMLVLLVCVVSPFIYNWTHSNVVSPPNGNPTAEINNDACCIVAIAVQRFVETNRSWPNRWNDIRPVVQQIISEIKDKRMNLTNPTDPFAGTDPFASTEENQGIFARLPDLPNNLAETIEDYVDVNFDFEIADSNKQNWQNFTGITPHKPSYNIYRVELQELIRSLKQSQNAE